MTETSDTPDTSRPSGGDRRRARAAARKERVRNVVGVFLLVVTFGWASAWVAYRTLSTGGVVKDKKVIRFAHWQLEGGIVDALDEAAKEYMRQHPDVVVRQIPIPERGYEQWVKTQLIGRTAPDLIELRTWVWANLIVRYFTPLDDVVERPNPYNAGTDLEGVPWKQTYIDNMRGGYVDKVQGHYGMPLSIFTVRCYANADLVSAATGWSKAKVRAVLTGEDEPLTLGALLDVCRAVKAYARREGRTGEIVPIAGSRYTANMFRLKYWHMAVWGLRDAVDDDLNGSASDAEKLEAFLGGNVRMRENPRIRAAHQVLFELGRQFNPGFLSTKRDERVLLFTRGNAAMIATGTWDAGTLFEYVGDDFDIVVFDFPPAGPDEEYGRHIRHRLSEAGARAGFNFGLTRFSRHPETAIDFMQFLTSRAMNQKINKAFRWFPAIRGAETDEILEQFRPKLTGVYEVGIDMHLGGDTQLRYEGAFQDYIGEQNPGPAHYRRFIDAYAATYEEFAFKDFNTRWRDAYQSAVQTEGALAQMRVQALRDAGGGRLTPRQARAMVSGLYGQVTKIQDRFRQRQKVDAVRRELHGEGPRP